MLRTDTSATFLCRLSRNSGSLNLLDTERPVEACIYLYLNKLRILELPVSSFSFTTVTNHVQRIALFKAARLFGLWTRSYNAHFIACDLRYMVQTCFDNGFPSHWIAPWTFHFSLYLINLQFTVCGTELIYVSSKTVSPWTYLSVSSMEIIFQIITFYKITFLVWKSFHGRGQTALWVNENV